MRPFMLVAVLVVAATLVDAAESSMQLSADPVVLKPFWSTGTVYGESAMPLAGAAGAPTTVPLLFVPTAVKSVTSSDGKKIYRDGRDYRLVPGKAALEIPPGSTIPLATEDRLIAKPGTQQFALTRRDGKGEVLFGAHLEWQDMQVVVTYTHADPWTGAHSEFAGASLPRTLGLLKSRAPLHLTLFGDSISVGWNASKLVGAAPYQPPYGELLVGALEHAYGAKVVFTNHSVSGQTASWGADVADSLLVEKPDLVVIAFGMNDACGPTDAATYASRVAAIMDKVRKGLPNAEFILVASMVGNAEWTAMNVDRFPAFRDALAGLRGPGVALCDATALWQDLLKAKRYIDLTGNGVNHPNDFGHRLYAQLLSALLIDAGK